LDSRLLKHNSSPISDEIYREKAAYFRRQLSKGCGRRPSWALQQALDAAAFAAADAWRARRNPTISPTERAHINREDRARQKQLADFKAQYRPAKRRRSFHELVAAS
jgi:hypothetical protein